MSKHIKNMSHPAPLLSVVIPVYKAEHCLDELYLRLKAALESISPDFEIILVEDCGGDGSWQAIGRLGGGAPPGRGPPVRRCQ